MRKVLAEADAAPITAVARLMMRQAAVSAVANRLRTEAWVRRFPEVLALPVERPVFVLGFPRTGTTLLQDVLSLHAGCRSLRFWELLCPTPVAESPVVDRLVRRTSARAVVAAAYFVAPEQGTIHRLRVDTAEECWPLFQNRFSALNNDLASGFSAYGDWLLQTDMEPAYRDYRRQLQVMQHRHGPARFVLKCPEHLWFLDSLLAVFPDARIVWTHRDPVASVASYSSLASLQMRNIWGEVQPAALGERVAKRFAEGVSRAMAARDRHPDAAFCDVRFPDLMRDPMETLAAVREAVGIAAERDVERAIAERVRSGRGDGRPKHVYTAEQWGLDPEAVRRRFRVYEARFLGEAGEAGGARRKGPLDAGRITLPA
jgi:CBS domain-containing protein